MIESRLVIADPSLLDARGHHYSLTLQITRGALAKGIDVVWFTHREFAAQMLPDGISVYPVFSMTMYDRYHPERKKALPENPDHELVNELEEGIERAGIGMGDHIYFHTGYGDLYRAIFNYVARDEWRNKPYIHVCTPYDLNTMPGRDPGLVLTELFKSMRTLEAIDKKIFFWAETPQLAQYYTSTFGFNTRAMPLPPPYGVGVPDTITDQETVTALYLGAAREEKGFLHLPELAESMYEKYGRSGKLRFVIQCSPQIIGYLPSIKAAIDKLASFPADYVKLIDSVLDEESYHANLHAADIVLLLYDQRNYSIRGSGIAVEALCANKCILTYKNTFCASLISHGGGGAVRDIDEAASLLEEMVLHKGEYRQMARLQGQQYRISNSAEKYVERLFKQADPSRGVPFFPSAYVGHVSLPLLTI